MERIAERGIFMIYELIDKLVAYGLKTGLVEEEDRIYTTNRLLELFGLEDYEESGVSAADVEIGDLEQILSGLMDYAHDKGILAENSVAYRDLFDTKIMSVLTARPSEIIRKFNDLYKKSPTEATDWYYDFSQNTDYIRRYRIKRDMKWTSETEYGTLDITINLSKPEKDPKAIAAAKNAPQSAYPKCQL